MTRQFKFKGVHNYSISCLADPNLLLSPASSQSAIALDSNALVLTRTTRKDIRLQYIYTTAIYAIINDEEISLGVPSTTPKAGDLVVFGKNVTTRLNFYYNDTLKAHEIFVHGADPGLLFAINPNQPTTKRDGPSASLPNLILKEPDGSNNTYWIVTESKV